MTSWEDMVPDYNGTKIGIGYPSDQQIAEEATSIVQAIAKQKLEQGTPGHLIDWVKEIQGVRLRINYRNN